MDKEKTEWDKRMEREEKQRADKQSLLPVGYTLDATGNVRRIADNTVVHGNPWWDQHQRDNTE